MRSGNFQLRNFCCSEKASPFDFYVDYHGFENFFFANISGLWCGNDVISETAKLLEIETLTASPGFEQELIRVSKDGIDQLKFVLLDCLTFEFLSLESGLVVLKHVSLIIFAISTNFFFLDLSKGPWKNTSSILGSRFRYSNTM